MTCSGRDWPARLSLFLMISSARPRCTSSARFLSRRSVESMAQDFCYGPVPDPLVNRVGCRIPQVGIVDASVACVAFHCGKAMDTSCRVAMFPVLRRRVNPADPCDTPTGLITTAIDFGVPFSQIHI